MQHHDIGSRTKSGLLWNTSLKILYQIIRFAISIIIARILEPRDFGIMGIAAMVIMYSDNITSFGFNRALVHRKEIDDTHIDTVFTVNLSISLLLTAVVIFLAPKIAVFFNLPELRAALLSLSCIFVISCFYQIPLTIVRRQIEFKIVAITELYRNILQSVVTLLFAILGLGYWALILGFISSYIFGAVYIYFKTDWKPRIKYSHGSMKDLFNFGFWNFIRAQTFQINEYADKFIIGKFLGPVLLGFYEKAFSTVAMQKSNFTLQVNSVMFSSFSRLQADRHGTIKTYLKKILSMTSMITFPLNIGLLVLGAHFVTVLLGNKWGLMIVPLQILSIAFIFNTMTELCSSMNIGTGSYINQTVRDVACNVLMIFICLILASYGIELVALGVMIVYIISFFATFQLTNMSVGMSWSDLFESIMPAVVGSIVMLLVIELSKRYFFPEINMANFMAMTIIGISTYALMLFVPRYQVLREYRSSVIEFIKSVLMRLSLISRD